MQGKKPIEDEGYEVVTLLNISNGYNREIEEENARRVLPRDFGESVLVPTSLSRSANVSPRMVQYSS